MKRPTTRAMRLTGAVLVAVVLGAAALRLFPSPEPHPVFTLFIHSIKKPDDPTLVIIGVLADPASGWKWEPRLASNAGVAEKMLRVRQIGATEDKSLFGSFEIAESELRFTPAAPLNPGATYRVAFDPLHRDNESHDTPHAGFGSVSGRGRLELIHQVPVAATVSPRIESLHPTAAELPANHLKFYLTFSEPMEQGVFVERIKLFRGDGSEIGGPFRETELWSPDARRLTVWLHPGRQKTGVSLNVVEGAVLREGETVTLVVSGEWRSTHGRKLGADFKRSFRIGRADHDQVDPARWTVHAPKQGTLDPLRIEFTEPLDWALLQNSLAVTTDAGKTVEGTVEVPDGERKWRFTPRSAWNAGGHRITINPVLEDLAGNNLNGSFETDASAGQDGRRTSTTRLRFQTQ